MSNERNPLVQVSPGCWIRESYTVSDEVRRAMAQADRIALELILSDLVAKTMLPEGISTSYGVIDLTGTEPSIDLR